MKAYLAWIASLVALIGTSYFSWESGNLHYLWEADVSKLSFLIMLIFGYGFFRLGRLLYNRALKNKKITEHDLDPGFEAANNIMAIGMLGTVVGIIVMTQSVASVDFSGVESIRQLFSVATQGMATAMFTTASGITGCLILRVMYYLTNRLVSSK